MLILKKNGELILLIDYKTNHVSKQDGADIFTKNCYKRQLDDYQQALEQMLQKKSVRKLISLICIKSVGLKFRESAA